MDLVGTKVLVLFLLGALRLSCGLLPLAITTRLRLSTPRPHGKVDAFISYFLCFGGGVLIATSFIHIIPEVREAIDAVKAKDDSIIPKDSEFPWGELFICIGFFLVYLLEEVVHRVLDTPGHDEGKVDVKPKDVTPVGTTVGKIVPTTSQVHLLVSSFSIDKLAKETPQVLPPVGGGEEGSQHHHHHHHHCTVHEQKEPPREPHDGAGSLRGLLVVVALSFHSVFEGLALGLQPTARDTWYLFGAVAVHTCALLTCIGLELATSGLAAARVVLYVSVLALVSPVGVAAGLIVTLHSAGGPQALVVAVLQGVAGGTIIYVTFFEVLERERRKTTVPGGGLAKLACVACGFGVMTAVQALGAHHHNHHHHHHHEGDDDARAGNSSQQFHEDGT